MDMRTARWVLPLLLVSASLDAQQTSDSFTWSAAVERGTLIQIRNVRGDVSVVPSTGQRVEVVAAKVWRRGNPAAVNVQAGRIGDAISICVLWGASRSCEAPIGAGASRQVGDVAVSLTVKVPSGMRIAVTNVNGDVSIETDSRVVSAETTNGNVVVVSSEGTVIASTVNGTVTAHLVEPVHATVDLRSRGRVQSDFPLIVSRSIRPGRIQARIGNGGRKIELQTAHGDIVLKRRTRPG